jgi:hypothetical protein
MTAYASNQSTDLRDFADTLYNAMFAKPGTCSNSWDGCLPDGYYLSGLDDGGEMMTEVPPLGNTWFGTFFGASRLSAWPVYRSGGAPPASVQTFYVSFNLGRVRGAKRIRVTATAPSGEAVQAECTSSPCAVAIDGRQGKPIVELTYISDTGSVLAKTASPL